MPLDHDALATGFIPSSFLLVTISRWTLGVVSADTSGTGTPRPRAVIVFCSTARPAPTPDRPDYSIDDRRAVRRRPPRLCCRLARHRPRPTHGLHRQRPLQTRDPTSNGREWAQLAPSRHGRWIEGVAGVPRCAKGARWDVVGATADIWHGAIIAAAEVQDMVELLREEEGVCIGGRVADYSVGIMLRGHRSSHAPLCQIPRYHRVEATAVPHSVSDDLFSELFPPKYLPFQDMAVLRAGGSSLEVQLCRDLVCLCHSFPAPSNPLSRLKSFTHPPRASEPPGSLRYLHCCSSLRRFPYAAFHPFLVRHHYCPSLASHTSHLVSSLSTFDIICFGPYAMCVRRGINMGCRTVGDHSTATHSDSSCCLLSCDTGANFAPISYGQRAPNEGFPTYSNAAYDTEVQGAKIFTKFNSFSDLGNN
ncbi:hypothetical protein DFH09DRAFT_1068517 [Mycena vulgaris]|nr:hypothetical protein DFH09DRAFT_1068517 [Mycena vulgaris]